MARARLLQRGFAGATRSPASAPSVADRVRPKADIGIRDSRAAASTAISDWIGARAGIGIGQAGSTPAASHRVGKGADIGIRDPARRSPTAAGGIGIAT